MTTTTPQKGTPVRQSGARESSAGDDFHILWAALAAVRLLDDHSGLLRIRLEGLPPSELTVGDDQLIGVDLAEYYRGGSVATADRVVVSQLKYSVRHPTRPWTSARLAAGGASRVSVIRRLAQAYLAFENDLGRDETLRKVSIRLISNQPIDSALARSIGAARGPDHLNHRNTTVQAVLRRLSPADRQILDRLRVKAKLSWALFLDFLRVLDISGLNEGSRALLQKRLAQAVGAHVGEGLQMQLPALYRSIQMEVLPEAESSPGLVKADLLAILGVPSIRYLFPCPVAIAPPSNLIDTEDVRLLASKVTEGVNQHLLAFGDAGVGKSTTLTSIEGKLPAGSVVVIYDCFGNGEYLSPGNERHTPRRALLQITNEMSVRCGIPILVTPPKEISDLWRLFRDRLDLAARAVNPSKLVLAIDAADNAVYAARVRSEPSFVPEMWLKPLPSNVVILMTARAHRREELLAPTATYELELRGFDQLATSRNLQARFTTASPQDCVLFHEASQGNPRIQFYVLQASEEEKLTLELTVERARLTPAQLFDDLVNSALVQIANETAARRCLADLVCMAHPVKLARLSAASQIDLAQVTDFCRALAPGVIIEHGSIAFRDEDFEKHLIDRLDAELSSAHDRLATYFLALAEKDEEAAREVAEHLDQAGRYGDLITLALAGEPDAIPVGFGRLQTYRRRISLALRIATSDTDPSDALKLLMLAGDAARSDNALTAVVRQNPELALLYGDPQAIASLYLRSETKTWLGPALLRTSAALARSGRVLDANDQLELGEAWIRQWARLSKGERVQWELTAGDIAAGVEAVYRLRGLSRAYDWLLRWRPHSFVRSVVGILAGRLARSTNITDLASEITSADLPWWVKGAVLGALWDAGNNPPANLVEAVSVGASSARMSSASELAESWIVAALEATTVSGSPNALVAIAETTGPAPPTYINPDYESLKNHDLAFRRVASLSQSSGRAASVEQLVPERLKAPADSAQSDAHAGERRQFLEALSDVFPAYVLRAAIISGGVASDTAPVGAQLQNFLVAAQHRWYRGNPRFRTWATVATDALVRSGVDASDLLSQISDAVLLVAPPQAVLVWLDMAERLIGSTHAQFGRRLIDRAAHRVVEERLPASDQTQILVRCAAIAARTDDSLARDCYTRAVAAADGLDDEGVRLLSTLCELAQKAVASAPRQGRHDLAERLARAVEAFSSHVSDTDLLPVDLCVRTVTVLAPEAGLALSSRWDDEGRLDLSRGIAAVVRACIDSDVISPVCAIDLLKLTGDRIDVVDEVMPWVSKQVKLGSSGRAVLAKLVQKISTWIARDLSVEMRCDAAAKWLNQASNLGLSEMAGVADIKAIANLCDRSMAVNRPSDQVNFRTPTERLALLSGLESITENISRFAMNRSAGSEVQEYLAQTVANLVSADCVKVLDQLAALPPSTLPASYAHVIISTVVRVSEAHSSSPAVRGWLSRHATEVFETYLDSILQFERTASDSLKEAMRLLPKGSRSTVVLPAVASRLAELRPGQLWALTEALADGGGYPVFLAVEWMLERLEAGSRPTVPDLPASIGAALAAFFWAAFGHPSKAWRWRAAHAVRDIAMDESVDLLKYLTAYLDAEEAGAFRSVDLPFYWMSARLWLVMLLSRIARDEPRLLQASAQQLAGIALDSGFPHAPIREFARRAALAVESRFPGALNANVTDLLAHANMPISCFVARGSGRSHSAAVPDRKWRFSFDTMDTLKYWYAPLGELFNLDDEEIAIRAEKWVVDVWGQTDDSWWRDRRELANDWQQTSHSHGGVPPLESLRTYLEYHAMLVVAGELADEGRPMVVEAYDDATRDPWTRWLGMYLDADPAFWVSDLRAATPVEELLQGFFPTDDKWRGLSNEDYDRELGLSGDGVVHRLVVAGDIDLWDRDHHGSVHVKSALVTPHTATALLRALQTAERASDYRLPFENEGSEYGGVEIDESPFGLLGWLAEIRSDRDCLEEHDPLGRIPVSFSIPGNDIRTRRKWKASSTPTKFTNQEGKVLASVLAWSDDSVPGEDDLRTPHSHGCRTLVDLPELLEYLNERGLDLVVEVQIARNWHSRTQKDRQYDLGTSRIYLIRRSGKRETLDQNRSLRPQDRSGIQS